MFDDKSRYARVTPIKVVDARGRVVEAVSPAPSPRQTLRGIHLRKQNERPDHLALFYLGDAAGYWRLAEMNDAMTAEVVADQREISIPNPHIEEGKP
jgi:hypothetical protein